MVKNFISAKDAKQLTEASEKPLNQVFRLIKDTADYGRHVINFGVYEMSRVVIDKVIKTLQDAGYSVETVIDDNKPVMLTIIW
jgi:hypothetical protein